MSAPQAPEAFATADQEVAGIEDALDALLTVALDPARPGRYSWRSDGPRAFNFQSVAEILAKTRAQSHAEQIIRDPVGETARMGVRALGERLHEIGGLELMQRVLDDVADRDKPNWGRRTSIMDNRWDGVGRTDKSAGWCA
jgi:hypothetical protein